MKLFNQVVGNRPKRNAFNLSHERKFSLKMGRLIPILCEEIIPGDSWKVNSEVLMRFAPMVAPIMHRVNVYTHFFFVPNRLIWEDWEEFITGGDDGQAMPVRPYFEFGVGTGAATMRPGQLADYLGFNTRDSAFSETTRLNALPFNAYNLIFNEYYRDQNLEEPITIDKSSGEISSTGVSGLKDRAWEKDYFTSALPWTQRGGDVTVPMGGSAPVVLTEDFPTSNWLALKASDGDPLSGTDSVDWNNENLQLTQGASGYGAVLDPNGTLEADLSEASGTTIEELRRATKLQQWLERNARGGSRYIEQILSHFGVISSDARLQRPEFLGGGKSPVVISEVLQTSSTDAETPQGNPAGHALAVGRSHGFKRTFEEHGYIMGIMSVMPKTAYQQGTRKHLLKEDKFEYFWPEFAQLGEQPVLQAELYDDYNSSNRMETFGYQSRYSEYKFIPSSVHGSFKDSLSYWHMGRIWSSAPALNNDFVNSKLDVESINTRVFAAGDNDDQLWVQVYHDIKALRPIPKFNNPSLL